MQHRLYWAVFVGLFTFAYICEARKSKDVPTFLSQLFKNQSKPPIIVYLNPKPNLRTNDDPNSRYLEYLDDNNDDDDDDERYLRTARNDERAYVLYNLLRTTLEDEDVESSEVDSLQYTKGLLRQALIGRCRKLKKCIKRCPEVKYTCTMQCKQVYDDLNACDEPKEDKCSKPKCGKTKPPYWL